MWEVSIWLHLAVAFFATITIATDMILVQSYSFTLLLFLYGCY